MERQKNLTKLTFWILSFMRNLKEKKEKKNHKWLTEESPKITAPSSQTSM